MFQTVRHWWTGGPGKVTVRLFLFEFFVVVLGVLVAQWVADWADERNAIAAMELERKALDDDIADFLQNVEGWAVAGPCLDDRMTEIMLSLATDQPLSSEFVRRPGFRYIVIEPMSADARLLMSQRHSKDATAAYLTLINTSEALAERGTRLIYAWQAMAQVDPANGPPSTADKQQARQAASAIKALLQSVEVNVEIARAAGRTLNIERNDTLRFGPQPSCAEIWRSGRTHTTEAD